jgi:hypothetical protein
VPVIDSLFYRGSLSQFLAARLSQVSEQLDKVCEQQLAANSDDEICQFVESQLTVAPLTLFRDSIQHSWSQRAVGLVDDRDTLVFGPRDEVPGVEIRIEIPYAGSAELWHLSAGQQHLSFPMGEPWPSKEHRDVGLLCLEYALPLADIEQEAKRRFEQDWQDVEHHLAAQHEQIVHFNQQLQQLIRTGITQKRQHLAVAMTVPDVLGLPLKRSDQAPDLLMEKMQRQTVTPLRASPASEPALLDEHYQHILKVIRLEGMSFERTPATFQSLAEESLRDIILAHLNGHYEGSASGETFNKNGKTDIHIPVEGRSAFVAECKLWRGPKSLLAAIDQLQGYLTWRDCRAAVVIFNKQTAGFSRLLSTVPQWLEQHASVRQINNTEHDNEWQLRVQAKEDAGRAIAVRLMVFNLYV